MRRVIITDGRTSGLCVHVYVLCAATQIYISLTPSYSVHSCALCLLFGSVLIAFMWLMGLEATLEHTALPAAQEVQNQTPGPSEREAWKYLGVKDGIEKKQAPSGG